MAFKFCFDPRLLRLLCFRVGYVIILFFPLGRMIGEYRERIPKTAPDALRKLLKTFTTEVRSFILPVPANVLRAWECS